MRIEEHLTEMELEIHTMNMHGHLSEFELNVEVNAIEHHIHEARKKIENGRQHNRDCDMESPD